MMKKQKPKIRLLLFKMGRYASLLEYDIKLIFHLLKFHKLITNQGLCDILDNLCNFLLDYGLYTLPVKVLRKLKS